MKSSIPSRCLQATSASSPTEPSLSQLFAPYGELARLERTTPFEIQITYAPPDAEPAEDAEPLADGEEPPPPKPFASVMSVAWIEM